MKKLFQMWGPPTFSLSILHFEIPVIMALLANFPSGEISIAVLGAALGIFVPLISPVFALGSTSAHFSSDDKSFSQILRFALGIGSLTALFIGLLVLGPANSFLFQTLLGLPESMSLSTGNSLLILGTAAPAVALRRSCQGVLIRMGTTSFIASTSLLRIVLSISLVYVFSIVTSLPGFLVAAVSLVLATHIETTILLLKTKRLTTFMDTQFSGKHLKDFLRFHFPLAGKGVIEFLYYPIIAAGLSRTADPENVLIIWPFVYGLILIFAGFMEEMEPVIISSQKRGIDRRTVKRFCFLLGLSVSLLWILWSYIPKVSDAVLLWSGFGEKIIEETNKSFQFGICIPFLIALRTWFRGIHIIENQPGIVQTAALISIVGLSIFVGITVLYKSHWNILVGAFSLTFAYFLDVFVLWIFQHSKDTPSVAGSGPTEGGRWRFGAYLPNCITKKTP